MRLDNREVMGASFDYQILLRVEIRQISGNLDVVRQKAIDLFVHRDRFEPESLLAIVLSNASKTNHRLRRVAGARVEIAQHVESGEVVGIDGHNLAVFFYRGRDLTHFEVFLGRTQSLYLVKSHYESSGLEQILELVVRRKTPSSRTWISVTPSPPLEPGRHP